MKIDVAITDAAELGIVDNLINGGWCDSSKIELVDSTVSIPFAVPETRGRDWWRAFVSSPRMPAGKTGVLYIDFVEKWELKDTEKVGSYDLQRVTYDPGGGTDSVITGVPLQLQATVRHLRLRVSLTSELDRQSPGT